MHFQGVLQSIYINLNDLQYLKKAESVVIGVCVQIRTNTVYII